MSAILTAIAMLDKATAVIAAGQAAASFASRAIEAANNGDDESAQKYLEAARENYASAREQWDNA